MEAKTQSSRPVTLWAMLVTAVLAGIFFRSYLLSDQVFIDDEWHGFYYALGKSPSWLLTHFSIPGATCIPLNFYTWLLGQTVGWTENLLRLPAWIFGVVTIIACPLLARKILDDSRAAWLALLLAISPLLIFYSRICRPYSAVAFLGFATLLLAAQFLRTGSRRAAVGFIIAGAMAVYFHLFAVITVAAPFFTVAIYYGYFRWRKQPVPKPSPPFWHWLMIGGIMAVLGAALVLPPLVHSIKTTFFNIAMTGTLQWSTVPRIALLMSGTGQPVLAVVFWLLVIIGAVDLCRRNLWFGLTLLSLYPLHAIALIFSRPDSAQSAIVLTRYCIPLVPVGLLFVACGLQFLLEKLATRITLRPALQVTGVIAFVMVLLSAGPLPQCYVAPNNFTSHGAFQHRYSPIDWRYSFYSDLTPPNSTLMTIIRADEISPFYDELAKAPNQRPIVEYPMMIGDHFNPFYYYQHFHRRPVMVGYATDVALSRGLAAGNVYGNSYIDQVLSLVKDQEKLRFRNLVNMDNLAAMRARHVEYIILHKRFEAQLPQVALYLPDIDRLNQVYRTQLGAPAYEDSNIVAFRL